MSFLRLLRQENAFHNKIAEFSSFAKRKGWPFQKKKNGGGPNTPILRVIQIIVLFLLHIRPPFYAPHSLLSSAH
jgi:hypothetical protein